MPPRSAVRVPMFVRSKFPSPPFSAISVGALHRVMHLLSQPFLFRSARPRISHPSFWPEIGFIDWARASCPSSIRSSEKTIGYRACHILSIAGQTFALFRNLVQDSESGGRCVPPKERNLPDDQSDS